MSRKDEIESELKTVNERILSKENLLKESPEDVGLQLGIMEFEDLKEDLIGELAELIGKPEIYSDYIKERLLKTQERLVEKKTLNIINPDDEYLNEDIKFYELMEKGLVKELEYCYLQQGIPIYELRLKGEKIDGFNMPLDELGDVLKTIHEVPVTISKFVYSRKKKFLKEKELVKTLQSSFNGDLEQDEQDNNINKNNNLSQNKGLLSDDLMNYSNLRAFGILEGSVRVILTTSQPTLNNQFSNDNIILNDTFMIFKDLVECGDNKKAIEEELLKLGNVEPITKYSNFLRPLFKYNIDVEFFGKNKELEDFKIFEITHEDATKIYKAINAKDDPISVPDIKIGTFRAVDLVDKKFKFHEDSDEKNVISGTFNKNLVSEMESKNFNDIYKIKLMVSTPVDKIKQRQKVQYELLEFLD